MANENNCKTISLAKQGAGLGSENNKLVFSYKY